MALETMKTLDLSLSFDPVIADIFSNTAQLEDEKVALIVEWFVYSLWLKQSLNTSQSIDSSIAAVLRNFDLNNNSGHAVPDFEDQLECWRLEHRRVQEDINEMIQGDKAFVKQVRNYLLGRIRFHNKNVPSKERQLDNMVGTLYKATSDTMYNSSTTANAEFNPLSHFQVGIVTWLKVCGGEPKVVETHNIQKGTGRADFLTFLTNRTRNVQVESLGYPKGLPSEGSEWLWRITRENLTLDEHKLETDEMYTEMTRQATNLPGDQKLIIIHSRMAAIPAVIEDGLKPPGFQPHFSEAPLDLTHLQKFLKTLKYENEIVFDTARKLRIEHSRWITREQQKRRKAEKEMEKTEETKGAATATAAPLIVQQPLPEFTTALPIHLAAHPHASTPTSTAQHPRPELTAVLPFHFAARPHNDGELETPLK